MVYDQRGTKQKFIYPQVECPELVAFPPAQGDPESVERVEGQFYLYLVECSDNSLYTGSSGNLSQRIKHHNSGKASEWTKLRKPVRLVYYEIYDTLLEARRRELQIKGWTRSKKENLIHGKWNKK